MSHSESYKLYKLIFFYVSNYIKNNWLIQSDDFINHKYSKKYANEVEIYIEKYIIFWKIKKNMIEQIYMIHIKLYLKYVTS